MGQNNRKHTERGFGASDSEKASGLYTANAGAGMRRATVRPVGGGSREVPEYEADRRRRRRQKLLIDILLFLLLVSLVGGLCFGAWKLIDYYTVHYRTVSLTYTVLFSDLPAETVLNRDGSLVVTDGMRMYLYGSAADREELGEILHVVRLPDTETNATGSTDAETAGGVNLLITVRSDARYHAAHGYRIADTRIAVGQTLECRFQRLVGTGTVVDLMESGKGAASDAAVFDGAGDDAVATDTQADAEQN